MTAAIGFNTIDSGGSVAGHAKEIVDDLPPGFAGDLVDTPTCSVAKFSHERMPDRDADRGYDVHGEVAGV